MLLQYPDLRDGALHCLVGLLTPHRNRAAELARTTTGALCFALQYLDFDLLVWVVTFCQPLSWRNTHRTASFLFTFLFLCVYSYAVGTVQSQSKTLSSSHSNSVPREPPYAYIQQAASIKLLGEIFTSSAATAFELVDRLNVLPALVWAAGTCEFEATPPAACATLRILAGIVRASVKRISLSLFSRRRIVHVVSVSRTRVVSFCVRLW